MVVSAVWTHSWIAVSISLAALLVLLVFLLICLCYDRSRNDDQQYYVLDEQGIKRIPVKIGAGADGGFFRRLSSAGMLRSNFRFSTGRLNLRPNVKGGCDGDKEFMDSLDFDKQFSNSVLQIDAACDLKSCHDVDDWRSCISVAPTRRNSVESVRSAVSDPGYFANSGAVV